MCVYTLGGKAREKEKERTDRQTDRQTGKRTDRQTDRQTTGFLLMSSALPASCLRTEKERDVSFRKDREGRK